MVTSLSFSQVILKRTNGIKLNLNSATATELPEVVWINPLRDDTGSEENTLLVEADVKSSSIIKSVTLEVLHSETTQPITKSFTIPEGATTYKVSQKLNLMEGMNAIGLVVANASGGEVKGTRSIQYGMDNNLLNPNRKDYALLIATDKYDNFNELGNPIFDAETIGKTLEDKYGFRPEILKNPSQDEIILALRNYSTRTFKDQDQLFIFFAGHGQYDPTLGDGYIIAKNTRANDNSRTSYIAYASLRQYINNINCKHIFVALDVCFGGTFDEQLTAHRSAYENIDDSKWLANKLSITTRKYLTSGGKDYVPDGTPGHHSPFAKSLIAALNSNGNEDQVLTMQELLGYFEKLQPIPRSGDWGSNESGSDFLFIMKQ
ncbi:MAG: caspase family protein [Cyclobacteriaceae bacterium]